MTWICIYQNTGRRLEGLYGKRKSSTDSDNAYGFGKSLLDGTLKSILGSQNNAEEYGSSLNKFGIGRNYGNNNRRNNDDQFGYGSSLNKFGIGRNYGNNNGRNNQDNGLGSLNGYGSKFGRNAFGYPIDGIDNNRKSSRLASLYGTGSTDNNKNNIYDLLKLYTKK